MAGMMVGHLSLSRRSSGTECGGMSGDTMVSSKESSMKQDHSSMPGWKDHTTPSGVRTHFETVSCGNGEGGGPHGQAAHVYLQVRPGRVLERAVPLDLRQGLFDAEPHVFAEVHLVDGPEHPVVEHAVRLGRRVRLAPHPDAPHARPQRLLHVHDEGRGTFLRGVSGRFARGPARTKIVCWWHLVKIKRSTTNGWMSGAGTTWISILRPVERASLCDWNAATSASGPTTRTSSVGSTRRTQGRITCGSSEPRAGNMLCSARDAW